MNRNMYLFIAVFFMVMFMPFTINQEAMINADNLKIQYNEAIDNATGAAAKALIKPIDNDSHEALSYGNEKDFQTADLDLKDSLETFYKSLYINLDIEDNKPQQQALLNKIPIIIATGFDGYYVHTWQVTKINGKYTVTNDWTSKKKYSIYDAADNIKISYTLDDYIYIEDLNTGHKYEGNRQSFANKYPGYFSDSAFNTVRSQVINKLIQNDLNTYTYNNNSIAKRFGWQLSFNTPLWGDRAISTVSFLAFIQGRLTTGAPDVYNAYGFGAAKIVRKKTAFGYVKNGRKLYSYDQKGTDLQVFDTPIDAAKAGYSPDLEYY